MNFRFKCKQLHSLAFSLLADILEKQIFCNLVLTYDVDSTEEVYLGLEAEFSLMRKRYTFSVSVGRPSLGYVWFCFAAPTEVLSLMCVKS